MKGKRGRLAGIASLALVAGMLVLTPAAAADPLWATFSGVVRDADGSPHAGVHVALNGWMGIGGGSDVTAADGSFSVRVAPGQYGLSLSDSRPEGGSVITGGFSVWGPTIELEGDRVQDLTLPVVTLDVSVLDPDGEPVAGAVVSHCCSWSPIELFPGATAMPSTWGGSETTDADGSARLRVFRGDSVSLSIWPPPESGLPPRSITASALEDTSITIGGPARDFRLALTPETTALHLGDEHVLSIVLTDRGETVAAAQLLVTVVGPHAATATRETDSAGVASYTYTGGTVGTDTVTVCHDRNGNGVCDPREARASATVEWTNSAPTCASAAATPRTLWPANGTFQLAVLSGISDPDGDAFTVTIGAVTQDEPVSGLGHGDIGPDARRDERPDRVWLRSERRANGDGRVYRIHFTAADEFGATCSGLVRVGVPRKSGGEAVDSGGAYDSFGW